MQYVIMLFENQPGLSFIINAEDNLIIPYLDVAKCNIEMFNNETINEWHLFCKNLDGTFKDVKKKIQKYKPTEKKNNILIKIPCNFKGCIWKNYPDLYNCNGEQTLLYLEKTRSKLSDLYIKTSASDYVISCCITPETFSNLSISNYSKLVDILIANGETNSTIWCAVACWWNYSNQLSNQKYTQILKDGILKNGVIQNYIEKYELRKKGIDELKTHEMHVDLFDNDDEWIKILNEYCCPKLYIRCNWFLMIHARAIINNSEKLINWINVHKNNIVWDEDLLSDTPSYAFNECYHYYDNQYISNELGRRFLK